MSDGQLLSIDVKGLAEVQGALAGWSPRAIEAMIQAVAIETANLQRYVVTDKLSGQVLGVVTGALRRSIQMSMEHGAADATGKVFSSGDVKYAAIHEFGFSGQENVRQHMRTMVFGRTVAPFSVGPFVRQMNMPERSFMRSSLADLKDQIVTNITNAVKAAALGATVEVTLR